MTGMAEVLVVPAPVDVGAARKMLRDLAEAGSAARAGNPGGRTWAILGEVSVAEGMSENECVVEHDLLGRQAVRLAVDKTLCVGASRAVRALHQGAVMEGSWGDEVRLVATAGEAREVLSSADDWRPRQGDVVLVAAGDPDIVALADMWRGGPA